MTARARRTRANARARLATDGDRLRELIRAGISAAQSAGELLRHPGNVARVERRLTEALAALGRARIRAVLSRPDVRVNLGLDPPRVNPWQNLTP